ncbi:hypothetical protein MXB_3842, partial [Myxobolus squamalis]
IYSQIPYISKHFLSNIHYRTSRIIPTYPLYAGGVTSISTYHYMAVNGFSNIFWGWGGEDDDFYERLLFNKIELMRVNPCLGQYKFIKIQHTSQYRYDNIANFILKSVKERMKYDGVNNVRYKEIYALNTSKSLHIKVRLKNEESIFIIYFYHVLMPLLYYYFVVLAVISYVIYLLIKLLPQNH